MIFKINSKHNDNYILTTTLFTNDLQLTSKSAISIPDACKEDFSYRISRLITKEVGFLRPSGTSDNDNIHPN